LDDGLAAADFVPAGRDAEADLLAAGRTDARLAAPGFAAEADLDGAADFAVPALDAADLDVADLDVADLDVADLDAVAFEAAGFDAVAFAAVVPAFFEAAVVAGFFAAAVVVGFFAAALPAAAPVAFFCDAAGLTVVVVLVPARLAAGLVGALVAAAIGTFLLANDCGLVSAWRLTRFRLGHRKSAPA
jgi:hypothetical protein